MDGWMDGWMVQFAFKPTGSTTAALVPCTHHITRLLEHNQYVSCLMMDLVKFLILSTT